VKQKFIAISTRHNLEVYYEKTHSLALLLVSVFNNDLAQVLAGGMNAKLAGYRRDQDVC